MGTIDDLDTTIRGKGEDPGLVGKIDKLVDTVDGLKNDRKLLTRLAVGWVIMALLEIVVVVTAHYVSDREGKAKS